MKNKLILTFDLEFWFNSQFLKGYVTQKDLNRDDFILESTESILDLLQENGHSATFFILGQVAEKYPALIKKITEAGHEIASHGYSHQPLNELSQARIKNEIELSSQILKKNIGFGPRGFRAPNFSLDENNLWVLKFLKELGFQYDSSLHPFKKPWPADELPEIPSTLGGIYFRFLPLRVFLTWMQLIAKTKTPMLYLHPYELFSSCPRIEDASWLKKKIKYWGVNSAWQKFKKLANNSKMLSIEKYLLQGLN